MKHQYTRLWLGMTVAFTIFVSPASVAADGSVYKKPKSYAGAERREAGKSYHKPGENRSSAAQRSSSTRVYSKPADRDVNGQRRLTNHGFHKPSERQGRSGTLAARGQAQHDNQQGYRKPSSRRPVATSSTASRSAVPMPRSSAGSVRSSKRPSSR